MKTLALTFLSLLAALQISGSAMAGDITGRATLMLRFSNFDGPYFVEVRQEDGRILGHSSVGSYKLEKTATGWDGFTNNGKTKIACTATACTGMASSKRLNLTISDDGTRFQGAVGFEHVTATRTDHEVSVNFRGSMTLRKNADGEFEGTGGLSMPNGFFDATLKTEGTDLFITDPALFIAIVIEPLARLAQ